LNKESNFTEIRLLVGSFFHSALLVHGSVRKHLLFLIQWMIQAFSPLCFDRLVYLIFHLLTLIIQVLTEKRET